MNVDQTNIIDFVTTNPETGNTSLVIADYLDWENVPEHLFCLQEKLNSYFRFIESGELLEKFPRSVDKHLMIEIVLKISPPKEADWFFEKARQACANAKLAFTWRVSA